jgi:hypothetical protein
MEIVWTCRKDCHRNECPPVFRQGRRWIPAALRTSEIMVSLWLFHSHVEAFVGIPEGHNLRTDCGYYELMGNEAMCVKYQMLIVGVLNCRYLLYVCDHHFSIVYGRPPVIHDHEPMRKWELYLQSPMATEGDTLVLSQVTLFTVLTRIFHFYEDESENEISEERLSHLPVFNAQLENWRNTWRSRLRMFWLHLPVFRKS